MPKTSPPTRAPFVPQIRWPSPPAASTITTTALADDVHELKRTVEPSKQPGPNDRLQIATIGMGIIGFIDTTCALKGPGVELVAASDLYEGRRTHAKEVFGSQVETYVDYREILARKDVDAVLICVPDHWHARMSIDAMKAGKAVYCEKPMIRTLVEEGPSVIAAAARNQAPLFQVGSQFASSVLYDKVKELISSGSLGKVHAIEARYNRNSDLGAWQYSIPTDASPATIDWDRFLGEAPKLPFDPVRFFRWRNYWDYGTAVAGDLFIHLLTGIHPPPPGDRAHPRAPPWAASGTGRTDATYTSIIMGLLDYPETSAHGSFTLSLVTDFEDGGGGATAFRFVGTEGVIDVSFRELNLTRVGIEHASANQVLKGYNSVTTFSNAQQKAFAEKYLAEHPRLQARACQGEVDREIRRRQGLRRASRPFREFLQLGARRQTRVRRRHLRLPSSSTRVALQRKLPAKARDRLGPSRDEDRFVVHAFTKRRRGWQGCRSGRAAKKTASGWW